MFLHGIGLPEFIMCLIGAAVVIAVIYGIYYLIRSAVRAGVKDAQKKE